MTIIHTHDGQRIAVGTSLVVVICPTCQMHHAIPESLSQRAIEQHSGHPRTLYVHCPAGHRWRFNAPAVSDADRLRRERERSARIQAELDQVAASRRGHKAAATRARAERDRLRARAAAGVCPCCNRQFQQLHRHMASQHPDFPGAPVPTGGDE